MKPIYDLIKFLNGNHTRFIVCKVAVNTTWPANLPHPDTASGQTSQIHRKKTFQLFSLGPQ